MGLNFTVIMPCYNSSAYLKDAIESITNQTYPDWELIAVNDGSTDDTLEMLESYSQKDSRIRVFSKENGGYCSAINVGLNNVSCDYFLLMGSDDRLSLDLFEKINRSIGNGSPDVICFRTLRFIDGENNGVDKFTTFNSVAELENSDAAQFEKTYPEHSEIIFTRDTSKMFKSSLLGDLRYFGKYGFDADGIFSMLFAHKAKSFKSVPVDGYLWTLRSDSLSGRPLTDAVNIDRISDWYLFYEALKGYDDKSISYHEKKHVGYYLNIIQKLYDARERKDKAFKALCNKCIRQLKYLIKRFEYKKLFGRLSFGQKLFLNAPRVYALSARIKKR